VQATLRTCHFYERAVFDTVRTEEERHATGLIFYSAAFTNLDFIFAEAKKS
jgi:hypothetical protein